MDAHLLAQVTRRRLGGAVRKGERGSLVVFASSFSRTEADETTGEESERDIPFLKGHSSSRQRWRTKLIQVAQPGAHQV